MRIVVAGILVMASATLAGPLTTPAGLSAAPSELAYDFEHLANGALNGQDGWLTVNTGNANTGQRHQVESAVAEASAPAGYDGSRAVTYRYSGSGVGGRASRINDATFSAMTLRPSGVTVIEIEMERTHWGSSFRLGRDVNGDNDLDNTEVRLGIRTRGEGTNKSHLHLPSGVVSSATTISGFNRYQLSVDRTQERASLWSRDLTSTPIGSWFAPAGLQNLATGFTTDGSANDPTTWNAIGLQTEGNRGFFNNLKFRWVDVSTRSVDFGDRSDGSIGAATVTVAGEYLTGGLRAEIISDSAGEFTFADGSVLVPVVESGTALNLSFTPLSWGDRTATLRIHGDDMAAPLDVSLNARGPIYVDDDFEGGGWQLVAYGANGVLPGPLTASAGAYDPQVRSGGAVLAAAHSLVTSSAQMAITWAQGYTPTDGIDSYTEGLWFALPAAESMTLTGLKPGANDQGFTAVTVKSVKGNWAGPATLYLRPDTFGANYGDSYGLVGSLTAGNPGADWGPDSQNRAAVYIDPGRARQSGATYARAYVTPSGTASGFVPSQMAVWVRNVPAAPQITAITSGDGNLAVSFTGPTGINGQISEIEYRLDGGDWTKRQPTSAASPLVITGVTVGATVGVEIRAVNAVGPGAASALVSATVRIDPPPVMMTPAPLPAVGVAPSPAGPLGVIQRPDLGTTPLPMVTSLPPGMTAVHGSSFSAAAAVEVVDDEVRVSLGALEARLAVVDETGLRMPSEPDGVISVDQGGLVEVEVRGLPPFVEGQLVVASTPVVIGTFVTDVDGRIVGTAPLPRDLPPGLHTLWLLTDGVQISVGLRVSEPPQEVTAPIESLLPSTGSDGRSGSWAVLGVSLGGIGVLMGRRRSRA
jgi:LPXTG-motif cell wall-anchored protein